MWSPFRLRKIIRESHADVLYSMLDLSNLIARIAVLGRSGKPLLVWGVRASALQHGLRALVPNRLCRFLSPQVPLIIANSSAGLRMLGEAGFTINRGAVVCNGIDVDQFRFDPDKRTEQRKEWDVNENNRLVTLVGRRDSRKGHVDFINAARSLAEKDAHMAFACIGPGSDESREDLERWIGDAGIGDRFRIVEQTEDMTAVFSASDVVVSASHSEGFPNVVAEAMSCGRKCVVTDVGESAALVGDCGVVVAPRDPEALASGVLEVVAMPGELGDRARSRIADEYSIRKLAAETMRAFRDA
jgi:glycosyltransferase involved in cell wall biosynthesis